MRRPLVCGNWKMNMTCAKSVNLVNELLETLDRGVLADVVVAPPFTALRSVSTLLEYEKATIALAAQNVHWKVRGAFTGEVSPEMLTDLNVAYAIVGHSERRHVFGETDEMINKRLLGARAASIVPILCVGETLADRDAGRTQDVVRGQLFDALDEVESISGEELVIAYEPVWAIGTGRAAHPEEANDVIRHLRALVGSRYTPEAARTTRILYGGSVTPGNALDIFREPDVDGALVGGASLDPAQFSAIVAAAANA